MTRASRWLLRAATAATMAIAMAIALPGALALGHVSAVNADGGIQHPACVRGGCGGKTFTVSYTALKTPVRRGTKDPTTITTKAGVKCALQLWDSAGKTWVTSYQTTTAAGKDSWNWTVPASTPSGNWKLLANCLSNGARGYVFHAIKVTA